MTAAFPAGSGPTGPGGPTHPTPTHPKQPDPPSPPSWLAVVLADAAAVIDALVLRSRRRPVTPRPRGQWPGINPANAYRPRRLTS
jgi:hypothetical protein